MSQEVRFVIAVECGTEISSQVMSKAKRSVGTRSLRIDRDTFLIKHNGTVKVPKQDHLFLLTSSFCGNVPDLEESSHRCVN
jgi:hypothetical protein